MGITPELSSIGKVVIIALMFIEGLGSYPLSLSSMVIKRMLTTIIRRNALLLDNEDRKHIK